MSIIKSVDEARKRGASDEQILQGIIEQNQEIAPSITSAFERGATPGQVLGEVVNQNKSTLARAIDNLGPSAGQFASDIGSIVAHPIKTVGAVARTGAGAFEKVVKPVRSVLNLPQDAFTESLEDDFDAVVGFFIDRYGSVDKAKETFATDPVGFAADIAGLVSGGSTTAAKGAAAASKVSRSTRVASALGKTERALEGVGRAASFVDPFEAVTRTTGRVVSSVAGSKPVAAGLRAVSAPFKGAFLPEVAGIADRLNVKMPASALSKSHFVSIVESLGAKGIFGAGIQKVTANAAEALGGVVDDLIGRSSRIQDELSAGKSILEGMDTYRSQWLEKKNELYGAAELQHGGGIPMEATNTTRYLQEVIDSKAAGQRATALKSDLKFFEAELEALKRPDLTTKEMRDSLKILNEKLGFGSTDPIATGNQATLKKLAALKSLDLDLAIKAADRELAAAIDTANAFYADGIQMLNGEFGKKIKKLENNPERIVDALVKNKSESTIPDLVRVIGPEATNNLRAAFLKKTFDKARSADGTFKPTQLKRVDDGTLRALFTDDQFQAFDEIRTLNAELARAGKITKGSQTAFVTRTMAIAGTMFVNPLAGVLLVMGDAGLTKFIQSKAGQKALTSGSSLNPAPAIRAGRRIEDFGASIAPKARASFQAGRLKDILKDEQSTQVQQGTPTR